MVSMTRLAAFALAASLAAGAPTARAAEAAPLLIGVAAPLSGSSEVLGRQVAAGAKLTAARLGKEGSPVDLVTADAECSADGGAKAAHLFVDRKVKIAVGFLCTEALEAALPILKTAGIPTLDVGVRASRLTDRRERTGYLIWRIAPRGDAEANAIARYLAKRWNGVPYGLVDDGAIYNRSLADAVRLRLEAQGMKASTVDSYRPAEEKQFGLARRIQKTGVTNLFIAGDRPDVAIIARDAASLGLDLKIVGGEALFDEASADAPLKDGIVSIGPLTRFPALADKDSKDPAEAIPEGYFGPAAAAVSVAAEAARAAAKGQSLPEILNTASFSTPLGAIRFDAKGDSDLDLFRAFSWQGTEFVPEAGG